MINAERSRGGLTSEGEVKKFVQMRNLEQLEQQRQMRVKKRAAMAELANIDAAADQSKRSLSGRLSGLMKADTTPAPDRMDLASVAVLAQIRSKRKELRWRPKWEYYLRLSLSWSFNFALMGICFLFSIIYSVSFGNNKTFAMVISWALAYGWTFAIVEPVQILILAGAPCLFNEDHACGRCMVRARFVYNELCAP